MKTSTFFTLVLVFCLSSNMFAQEGSITLDFFGEDSESGENVSLQRVEINNLTNGSDTVVIGPQPSLTLNYSTGIKQNRLSNEFEISECYPNPFHTHTQFSIKGMGRQEIKISLHNISGENLTTTFFMLPEGNHNFELSGGNQGVYILLVENGKFSFSQKLISKSINNKTIPGIKYLGESGHNHNYKYVDVNEFFVYEPGDQLYIEAFAESYLSSDMIVVPEVDTNYNFQLLNVEKNIFIELFTGHKDVNSPSTVLLVEELKQEYQGRLISTSIHAGYYAAPDEDYPFNTNYSSEVGEELYADFGVNAIPVGLIDRIENDNVFLFSENEFEQAIENESLKDAILNIFITWNYNMSSNELIATGVFEFVRSYSGELIACCFIDEDGLVSAQSNNDQAIGSIPYIEFFEHNNVLRASLNGTYGTSIGNGAFVLGDKIEAEWSGTLDESWAAENCSVICLVYDSNTMEILQVEKLTIYID